MEWVETTARTVDEAKDLALDQLGVAEDDAEIVVVDEPKSGLFGRLRGEARVRVRVRPTQARQKVDRRDRRKPRSEEPQRDDADAAGRQPASGGGASKERSGGGRSSSNGGQVASPTENVRREDPQRQSGGNEDRESAVNAAAVGEQARRFVDELVEAFGLSGETTLIEDGDDLEVNVAGADLGLLVGPRGATLQAVQDLARVASQRRLGDHNTRLRVDVGGYRARRKEALGRFAQQVADEVLRSGAPRAMEPMPSSDRKIVHEALADVAGVSTRSEGDDPDRRVVIDPTGVDDSPGAADASDTTDS